MLHGVCFGGRGINLEPRLFGQQSRWDLHNENGTGYLSSSINGLASIRIFFLQINAINFREINLYVSLPSK